MRRIISFMLLLCLGMAPCACLGAEFWPSYLFYYWDRQYADARSASLGGADLAVASGPAAHFHSAAPLQTGETIQVGYSAHDLAWADLRYVSVAGEWRNFRFGFTRAKVSQPSDPMTVDYLYNFGIDDEISLRCLVYGVSYNLVPALPLDEERWQWTVGVNYRDYDARLDAEEASTGELDIGSTVAWRQDAEGRWWGVNCAATGHNVLGRDFELPLGDVRLAHSLRAGLAVHGGLVSAENPFKCIEASLSYVWIENLGRDDHDWMNADNLGLELVLGDIFSARWGHRGRGGYGENDDFSIGLQTPRALMANGGLRVSQGGLSDGLYDDGLWTFSAWVDF